MSSPLPNIIFLYQTFLENKSSLINKVLEIIVKFVASQPPDSSPQPQTSADLDTGGGLL